MRAGDRDVEPVEEEQAVGQPGQRVVIGEVLDLRGGVDRAAPLVLEQPDHHAEGDRELEEEVDDVERGHVRRRASGAVGEQRERQVVELLDAVEQERDPDEAVAEAGVPGAGTEDESRGDPERRRAERGADEGADEHRNRRVELRAEAENDERHRDPDDDRRGHEPALVPLVDGPPDGDLVRPEDEPEHPEERRRHRDHADRDVQRTLAAAGVAQHGGDRDRDEHDARGKPGTGPVAEVAVLEDALEMGEHDADEEGADGLHEQGRDDERHIEY